MPVLGVTGGVATGKSSVAGLFAEKRTTVISADGLVREIYAQKETLRFVKERFPEVVSPKSRIDFAKLREKAFNEPETKAKLEGFLHQRIPEKFLAKVGHLPVVYEVPLLFEKNLADQFDIVVVVYAPPETQLKRLVKRDGVDEELARKMLDSQWPIDKKRDLADFVIDNRSTKKDLRKNFEHVLAEILSLAYLD